MKEKIKYGFTVTICSIFIAVLLCGVASILITKYRENNQSAKNEVIEVVETTPQVYITVIPLSRVIDIPDEITEEPIETPEPIEEVRPADDLTTFEHDPPKKYTDEDVIAMAKLLYGEARGVKDLYIWDGRVISSEYQKACVIWSVLNRYDAGWENSIIATVSAYKQFHGYDPNNPVLEEFTVLAYDVLERWNREQYGETDVGRVLPSEYIYFYGDNKTNWFMDEYGSSYKYKWDLGDPYV